MATRIIFEWALQIGLGADGLAETRGIGHELEDNFGGGNVTTRLALCLDVLNPVLFALVRPHVAGKSGYAVATRRDFAKRYKDAGSVPAETDVEPGIVSRLTKEWVVQVGTNAEGGAELRCVGYEVEDVGTNGAVLGTRLKLCLDALSPVLYQLVKGHVAPGSAYVYAVREERVRRVREGGPGAGEVAANGVG